MRQMFTNLQPFFDESGIDVLLRRNIVTNKACLLNAAFLLQP